MGNATTPSDKHACAQNASTVLCHQATGSPQCLRNYVQKGTGPVPPPMLLQPNNFHLGNSHRSRIFSNMARPYSRSSAQTSATLRSHYTRTHATNFPKHQVNKT